MNCIPLSPFTCSHSVAFRTWILLCDHHHYLSLELLPPWKLGIICPPTLACLWQSPPCFFFSISWIFLCASYEWDHSCIFFNDRWLISLNIMFSCFIISKLSRIPLFWRLVNKRQCIHTPHLYSHHPQTFWLLPPCGYYN